MYMVLTEDTNQFQACEGQIAEQAGVVPSWISQHSAVASEKSSTREAESVSGVRIGPSGGPSS